MYASVSLPIALKPLTYKVPENLSGQALIGMGVRVPLRKKILSGYIVALSSELTDMSSERLKEITAIDDSLPAFTEDYLKFLRWIADYYHYPLGEVIDCALPPKGNKNEVRAYTLTQKGNALNDEELKLFSQRSGKRLEVIEAIKGGASLSPIPKEFRSALKWLVDNEYVELCRSERKLEFLMESSFPGMVNPTTLTAEQTLAFERILDSILKDRGENFLLHGITGSGKTEVYLSCAQQALAKGKSVLVLVPEISLTPQLFARVRARLGREVAILHSNLSDSARSEQWRLIHSGRARVALGARSTIFAPLKNLGLIVVDEEHEGAFKQEDRLRYNARDMALLRGRLCGATIILGSATPSLESYYHSLSGKLTRLELKNRPQGTSKPKIEVVDMKLEPAGTMLSGRLKRRISEVLDRKKQAILFLNRRGFSSHTQCRSCGESEECPNCSVSLTRYEGTRKLVCHYCDYSIPIMNTCSKCGSSDLELSAFGTESLETEIKALYPDKSVVRIDRQTTALKGELEDKLRRVADGQIDIVIGTQMIAKGHDFPHVELAAVVNADVGLNVPDFRAYERSFQLFTQVAGRAGRRETTGVVVIQTFDPDCPAVVHAKNGDYEEFCRTELDRRQDFHYPPYHRLARILITASSEAEAQDRAQMAAAFMRKNFQDIEILGPSASVVQKIKNRYRWNVLLKSATASTLNHVLRRAVPILREQQDRSWTISVDVDPVSLL